MKLGAAGRHTAVMGTLTPPTCGSGRGCTDTNMDLDGFNGLPVYLRRLPTKVAKDGTRWGGKEIIQRPEAVRLGTILTRQTGQRLC
jgi:hypothetical protein